MRTKGEKYTGTWRVMPQIQRTKSIIQYGNIELDTRHRLAWCGGLPVRLTGKECALLTLFLQAPGQLFTREELLARVWGISQAGALRTRTVDMHVHSLRQKLGPTARVVTVFRRGYKWEEE